MAPLVAEAQSSKVWRIGYLTPVIANGNPRLVAFQQRLRELGYVEPQNVVLDIRSADGNPAKALGLNIPPLLLERADEVIK